jgi:hypothetical protein
MAKQSRRGEFYVGTAAVLLILLGVGGLAWLSAAFPYGFVTSSPRQPEEDRTGTVVVRAGGGCKAMTFDNDTGRLSPPSKCDEQAPARDPSHLVPAGTVRRLDAISNSFSR